LSDGGGVCADREVRGHDRSGSLCFLARPHGASGRADSAKAEINPFQVMIILHVSNLRFNRRWYHWLLDSAPRHDLLVIAGNLVDYDRPESIKSQREWVRAWLVDYGRPACLASGPEDRVFDPQANAWRPADWLKEIAPSLCLDEDFAEHRGFSVHCIRYGDRPADRHADIWVAFRDPRVAIPGASPARLGGCDDLIVASASPNAPIVLTGDDTDRLHWHSFEDGTLNVIPGWRPSAAFPNHVLLDPATLAACRVCDKGYFPEVEVLEPRVRHAIAPSPRVELRLQHKRYAPHVGADRKPASTSCLS
jgi:hypothetical protein